MDPTNYWGQVDLTQIPSVTGPLQAYQQSQAQSVARQFAMAQAARQQQQQAIGDAAFRDAVTNPTPKSYAALAIARPETFQSAVAAHKMQDDDQQQTTIRDLSAVNGYLQAKQPDQALGVLDKYISAAKAAGKDTASYEAFANSIKSDPATATALSGGMLAALAGPDKYAEAYGKLGDEGRAQAAAPGLRDLTTAQTDLATAQAGEARARGANLANPPPKTAVNPQTGEYYNENGPPPAGAGATGANNGAVNDLVRQIQADENSTGNPSAKNPNSSATGNGQFLNKTWLGLVQKYRPDLMQGRSPEQVLALRSDPNLSAQMIAANAQDNAATLSAAGAPVNNATLALAHRLGAADAQKVLSADASTPLSKVLSPEVIAANPELGKQAVGAYVTGFKNKYGVTPIDAAPGDPNASGDEFLKTLAPGRAKLIKSIADGDAPAPSGRAATSGQGQLLMQQVLQYDPTASAINLDSRKKTREQFTSGIESRAITSINTTTGHLVGLDNAIDKLSNTGIPVVNWTAQALGTNLGNKDTQRAVADFNFYKVAVANELTKVFRGSNGAEADVQGWINQLQSAKSPTELHTTVHAMIDGMQSRLESLGQQYSQGMGKVRDPLTLISPHAAKQLETLNAKYAGGGANMPPTDAVELLRSNPALAAQFDQKYGAGASKQFLVR